MIRVGDARSWGRTLVASLAAGVLVLGFTGAFNEAVSPGRLVRFYGITLVYTIPVGVLLGGGLELLQPWIAAWPPPARWAARVATILPLTAVGMALATLLLTAVGFYPAGEFGPRFWGSFRVGSIIATGIAISVSISENLRNRLEETTLALRTKQLEEERARQLATEAQLAALESRIHPHFLFNTLNTIAALIQEDPSKAERTVGQLAALLRFSLDATTRGSAPLAQELRIVRDYLDIESARFGDRLRVEMEIDPDLGEIAIPPLSVQTLVENAVKHGLSTRAEGGRIRVRARRLGGDLAIDVADNGEDFTAAAFPAGHGLDNLRGRLAALFGGRATLRLSRDGAWTVASIHVAGPAAS